MLTPDTYVETLSEDTPRAFAFQASDPDEAREWQMAFRPALKQALGLGSIAARGKAPLRSECIGREDLEDHVREDWVLETEPGFQLPFYLLLPRGAEGPRPLVLTPHGHNPTGRRAYAGITANEDEARELAEGQRDIALQAVREGYVAIAPTMRGFLELRRGEGREKGAGSSCRTMQMHALLFGRTLVGERVWDVQRLIDWAETRGDIDASRIVVTGNSGGGTVSLFSAAVDERISVCVPGSYFCTFQDSIGSIHHCECNYVPGIMGLGEMWDVAGLIAPRPFMAVCGEDDPIFPIRAVRDSFARLQEIYGTFGAADSCCLSVNPGGHRYYKRDVWPFVRSVL